MLEVEARLSVCSEKLSRPVVALKLFVLVLDVVTGGQWGWLYRADTTAAMDRVR